LLSLQKGPEEWEHRDELLFTIVHQASELWLKLATSEISEAIEQTQRQNVREPQRHLNHGVLRVHQIHNALEMLEKLSPENIDRSAGH
jgi:tryptophan 2,3-dioxygenase